ncbi:MAG: hypothetical protein EAZ07_08085 [Cytophagales bacterium]|nr:MAG: hypothetical protein EAZ07_08085 [Cytophagales bacterium]
MISTSTTIVDKIQLLESKIKSMLLERQTLHNELKNIRLEIKKLETCLEDQNEDLKKFQNQDKITKIVNVTTEQTKSTVELRMLLNQYIREIDKCIAHISE